MAQWVRSLDLTAHTRLSPIRRGFAPSFVNYKKGCTRLASASDRVYQLLVQGRWFSSGTEASSTTKTGRHDIAEILLKVALNTITLSISYIKNHWKIRIDNTWFSFILSYCTHLNEIHALQCTSPGTSARLRN